MDIGIPELLIVLVIVLLLFGSSRLPKLSRTIGESMKELRNGLTGTSSTPPDQGTEEADEKAPEETQI